MFLDIYLIDLKIYVHLPVDIYSDVMISFQ